MLVTILDVALVPWQLHAFPASCYVNSLCANVVLEKYKEGGLQNLFGQLEQVTQVLTTQRQEKLSVNS